MSIWNDYLEGVEDDDITSINVSKLRQRLLKKWSKIINAPVIPNVENSDGTGYEALEGRVYSIGKEKVHLCTKWCNLHPKWCNDKNLVTTVNDMYINNKTKCYHICSENCNGKKIFSDGVCTCTISGLRYTNTSWVNSYRSNHEYHRTSNTTVRVEQEHLQTISAHTISRLLFSNKRKEWEIKRQYDTLKEIKKKWVKYQRHCEKKNIVVDAMYMIHLALHVKKRKSNRIYNIPDEETQKIIIDFYTTRVSVIWQKLKNLTNFSQIGKKTTNNESFITAVLYIMRKGLTMNDVTIINKDLFLETALPEANALDQWDIAKTHFTSCKNMIYASLRDALTIHYISPYRLMPLSLSENLLK